jgi:hypothetical protein
MLLSQHPFPAQADDLSSLAWLAGSGEQWMALAGDFPQRIMYRALPHGRLAARIEGLRGGTLRGVDFPMKRVACDTAGK